MVAINDNPKRLFPLGDVVATPGAINALLEAGESGDLYISCHACGIYGDICEEDRKANERAIIDGSRILSAYQLRNEVRIWIVTESDRSVTTILLPEEY